MSSDDFSWSLYNSKSEVQIDGLNSTQAKAIVSSMTSLDLPNWLAWREGLKDWSLVTDFTELFGQTALKKIPPSPPKSKSPKVKSSAPIEADEEGTKINTVKSYSAEKGELTHVNFLIEQYAKADSRTTARFEKKYPVVIRFDNVEYKSQTANMSRGGIKLDQLLPSEACGANITVEITRHGVMLTLNCQAIPEPKLIGVSRLIINKTSDDELLRTWLLEPGIV